MIKRLLILNGLAIIAAVIHHSTHWVLTGMFWWTDRYRPVTIPNYDHLGGISYYIVRIVDQFGYSGVAAFLFVTGIFIAIATGRDQKTVSWKIVFTRIKTLVIPYLFWSALIIPLNIILGESYSIPKIIHVILTGGATVAYYYVPLLVGYLLLSPFIVPLARNYWKFLIVVSALFQLLNIFARYVYLLKLQAPEVLSPILSQFLDWQIPANIVWFVLGMIIGFHISEARQWLAKYKWLVLMCLGLAFILGPVEWEILRRNTQKEWIATQVTFFDQIFTLFLLLTYIAWDNLAIPWAVKLSNIGTQSYGIYLTHMPVLDITAKATYHFLPALLAYPLLFQLVLVVLGLGAPLTLMMIVNRSPAQRFYKYMFG